MRLINEGQNNSHKLNMDQETIFVVDDNRQIANFWAETVLPNLGFQTLVAYDGSDAIETVRNNDIALMLLDLQLPDISGLDILRQLAKDGLSVPSILITANGSEHVAAEAFRLGVEDYLSKPVNTDQLEEAINRALSETHLRREKENLTIQLKEQLANKAVLADIGKSITSSLDINYVLRKIVEAAVDLTKAEEGFLALLDNSTGQLYLRAEKNLDQEKSRTIRLPVSDELISKVFKTGKPVRISSPLDEEAGIKLVTGFLVQSLLHVPILSMGRVQGVLSVVNRTNAIPFNEKNEALLISLADYAAIAIENASLYHKAQQEIRERKRVEETLRVSEERYALAAQGSSDGIWDWDLRKNQIYYSPRWKTMLGFQDDEINEDPKEWFSRVFKEDIEGLKLDISAHLNKTTSHFENEHRIVHKDGSTRWMLCRGLAVFTEDGMATRVAGSLTDITEWKYAEQKLLHDAFYDKLTGIPNRALFMDHLRLAVERAKRKENYAYAVLFLDIDRFKDVNDIYGHLLGDKLLSSFAQLLEKRMRSTDTIARFGGDEFVILLDDINNPNDASNIAEWIQSELKTPFFLEDREVYISVSTGIVLSELEYDNADDVLRDADIAMYDAKANGKSRYEMFEPDMRIRIMDRLELENDLRRSIENDELDIHYQMIVSLNTGKIIGFEALARWNHPTRGQLSPAVFIPLAEETGLIISIDRWVMRKACLQLKKWQVENPAFKNLAISVNLSGRHFEESDLIEYIRNTIAETELKAEALKLEITESTLMDKDDSTLSTLAELQNLGVQIQIDDFGTGYSSLSYLSNFPIDALKIDNSFVRTMLEDSNNLQIIQAIISLSNRLGVGVIAEGVESQHQLLRLKELGCEYGQGFYVSMPMAEKDISTLLSETASVTKNGHLEKITKSLSPVE
jgi:diguanylate cyclase (GGDEF)-like protein/PAS domain S-box-containing protein